MLTLASTGYERFTISRIFWIDGLWGLFLAHSNDSLEFDDGLELELNFVEYHHILAHHRLKNSTCCH